MQVVREIHPRDADGFYIRASDVAKWRSQPEQMFKAAKYDKIMDYMCHAVQVQHEVSKSELQVYIVE
jgi:hypothetical protein